MPLVSPSVFSTQDFDAVPRTSLSFEYVLDTDVLSQAMVGCSLMPQISLLARRNRRLRRMRLPKAATRSPSHGQGGGRRY